MANSAATKKPFRNTKNRVRKMSKTIYRSAAKNSKLTYCLIPLRTILKNEKLRRWSGFFAEIMSIGSYFKVKSPLSGSARER
jgi:hypothetical protein